MKHLQLNNPHFIKAHQQFIQRKKDEGKSDSHIQSVDNASKEFLNFLERKKLNDLNQVEQQTITGYFHYLEHRPNQRRLGTLSPAYLNKHREAVLRFFEFLHGVDIGQCPFFIREYKTDNIPKDILTEEEVKQLFENQGNDMDGIRNKAILGVLYGCGLRKGELHRLDVHDIDFNRNTLRVKRSKTFVQRDVPISPNVRSYLEEYLYGVREILLPDHKEGSFGYAQEPAFLLNNNGERLSLHGIQYKIKQIALMGNVPKPITAHRLRHAIATHLVDHATIEEIALFLGHSNMDSSQVYTHIKYTKLP